MKNFNLVKIVENLGYKQPKGRKTAILNKIGYPDAKNTTMVDEPIVRQALSYVVDSKAKREVREVAQRMLETKSYGKFQ